MDTGAHIICNLVVQSRSSESRVFAAVLIGAMLPDLPIMLFYAWESLVMNSAESEIWSELYFKPGWQNFFDTFNSLPLIVVLLALGTYFKKQLISVLALSMALHVLLDLPFHHDDAHRHFFPFADWRFFSPVSYWDPKYHGDIMHIVQIVIVIIGLVVLWLRHPGRLEKATLAFLGVGYLLFQVFVATVWSG